MNNQTSGIEDNMSIPLQKVLADSFVPRRRLSTWKAAGLAMLVCAFSSTAWSAVSYDDEKEKLSSDSTWTNNPCRQSICLNGEWDFMPVGAYSGDGSKPDTLTYPPDGTWAQKKIKVPASWNNVLGEFSFPGYGQRLHKAWYKRNINVPRSMEGQRIFLDFKDVSYDAVIYVNGKLAGRHIGNLVGFNLDVTSLVHTGKDNVLEVGVVNWTNAFKDHTAVYPISMHVLWDSGILQDVFLRSSPKLYVKDVFILTSTRKQEIEARIELENLSASPGNIEIKNEVRRWTPGGMLPTIAMSFKPHSMKVGKNSDNIALREEWKNPKLWTPETPNLYVLVTSIYQRGKLVDKKCTRFGFREFYAKGSAFYLNGKRINLYGMADQANYQRPTVAFGMPSVIRAYYRQLKAANMNCVRFFGPHPDEYYALADEAGIMIIDGSHSPFYISQFENNSSVKIKDTSPYGNKVVTYDYHYDEKLLNNFFYEKTRQRRNHPSIVMVCMQNEYFTFKEDFADKVAAVRKADETLLVTASGAADSTGVGSYFGPTAQKDAMKKDKKKIRFSYSNRSRPHPPDMDGLGDVLVQHYPHSYGNNYYAPGCFYIYDSIFMTSPGGKSKIRRTLLNLGDQSESCENLRTSLSDGKLKPLLFGEVPTAQGTTPDTVAYYGGNRAYQGVYDPMNGNFHRTVADIVGQMLEVFRYYDIESILYFNANPLSMLEYPNYQFHWKDIATPGLKPDMIKKAHGYLSFDPFHPDKPERRTPYFYAIQHAFSPLFLDLREPNCNFFGGTGITRTVTISNNNRITEKLTLNWELKAGNKTLNSGSRDISLEPGNYIREHVRLAIPPVSEKTKAEFSLSLARNGKQVRRIVRNYTISPDVAPSLSLPAKFKLGVYGHDARLEALVKYFNLKYHRLKDSELTEAELKKFDSVILRYKPGLNKFLPALMRYAIGGGKVIFIGGEGVVTKLPFAGIFSDDKKVSMSYPCNVAHPVLNGLSQEDLRWWNNPYNIIAYNSYSYPQKGNAEILAANGSVRGLNHTPLFIQHTGKGYILVCNFLLCEEYMRTPPARTLAANIIKFAAQPCKPEFKAAGLIAAAGSDLTKVMETMTAEYKLMKSPGDIRSFKGKTIIADASQIISSDMVNALREYAAAGGRVVLKNLTPKSLPVFSSVLPPGIKLKKSELDHSQLLLAKDDALEQITNSDLYWYLPFKGQIPMPYLYPIADWMVDEQNLSGCEVVAREPGWTMHSWRDDSFWIAGRGIICADLSYPRKISEPGVGIFRYAIGKGNVLVDQTNWKQYAKNYKAKRMIERMLAAWKVNRNKKAKVNLAGYHYLKLAPFCNSVTTMRLLGAGGVSLNDGINIYGGIPFTLTDASLNHGKNCLFVGQPSLRKKWKGYLKPAIKNIKVGRRVSRLFFLASSLYDSPDGAVIAKYRINFKGRRPMTIPVKFNRDVADWFYRPSEKMGKKASVTLNRKQDQGPAVFYIQKWLNPFPGSEITSIDILAGNSKSILWLLAISLRE